MKRSRKSLAHYQRQRRLRRGLSLGAALVMLIVLAVADRHGWLLHHRGDLGRYHGRWFTVARVIDGDTLDVDWPDAERFTTRVRLWGIDAPEMARQNRPAQPLANEAADLLRELCEGQPVRLWLQPHRLRGRYGRLLAYVELHNGQMANEVLLARGLARADDRWPHRDLQRYALIEHQARHEKVGLWAP